MKADRARVVVLGMIGNKHFEASKVAGHMFAELGFGWTHTI